MKPEVENQEVGGGAHDDGVLWIKYGDSMEAQPRLSAHCLVGRVDSHKTKTNKEVRDTELELKWT